MIYLKLKKFFNSTSVMFLNVLLKQIPNVKNKNKLSVENAEGSSINEKKHLKDNQILIITRNQFFDLYNAKLDAL